jgi:hypothetical protein
MKKMGKHIFVENYCIFCDKLRSSIHPEEKCEYPVIIKTDDFKRVSMLCENGYELKFVVPVFTFKYGGGYTTLYYFLVKKLNN